MSKTSELIINRFCSHAKSFSELHQLLLIDRTENLICRYSLLGMKVTLVWVVKVRVVT